jgi:hypothetical protein
MSDLVPSCLRDRRNNSHHLHHRLYREENLIARLGSASVELQLRLPRVGSAGTFTAEAR